jgi:SPP1 family predicted phage head-tail adaptor
MQAGHLYEVITIQQKAVTRSGDFGSESVAWSNWAANVHANVTDVSGSEAVRQGVRVGDRSVQVMIRWRAGITTDMRIVESDGRIFQIVAILEIPRKRGLTLHCLEYTAPQ